MLSPASRTCLCQNNDDVLLVGWNVTANATAKFLLFITVRLIQESDDLILWAIMSKGQCKRLVHPELVGCPDGQNIV